MWLFVTPLLWVTCHGACALRQKRFIIGRLISKLHLINNKIPIIMSVRKVKIMRSRATVNRSNRSTVNMIITLLIGSYMFILTCWSCILNPKTFTVSHLATPVSWTHRRGSSVNFDEGNIFLPQIMYEELKKCPNFTYLLEKLTKFPNFTRH